VEGGEDLDSAVGKVAGQYGPSGSGVRFTVSREATLVLGGLPGLAAVPLEGLPMLVSDDSCR
jgi:hypothetical protein